MEEKKPQAALEYIDPGIEVDFTAFPGGSLSQVGAGRGTEGLQRVLSDMFEDLESLEWTPRNFIDAGDCVIVWLRAAARGRKSGVPVEDELAAVYTVKDGLVVALRAYDSLAAAASAVGI